jgi:hypothetical protein
MKIFRRTMLVGFLVVACALPVSAYLPESETAQILGNCSVAALFGVQLWCVIFLKSEPVLSRIGLLIVTFFAAFLFLWMAVTAID